MKQYISIFIFNLLSVWAFGQHPAEKVVADVLANNTELKRFQQQIETETHELKAGFTLANPEVEYNYLWSDDASMQDTREFSVTQSFDFPFRYLYSGKAGKAKQKQLEFLKVHLEKKIANQVQLLCTQLVFVNKQIAVQDERINSNKEVVQMLEKKLQVGNATILELNKAKIKQLALENTQNQNRLEQQDLLSRLQQLNGGQAIEFSATTYPQTIALLPTDSLLASYTSRNPLVQAEAAGLEFSQYMYKLEKTKSLPSFELGYTAENSDEGSFHGIHTGISIPLWENRHNKQAAKSKQLEQELSLKEVEQELSTAFEQLLKNYELLRLNYEQSQQTAQAIHNDALLKTALQAGEISALQFYTELEETYELADTLSEQEKDLRILRLRLVMYW